METMEILKKVGFTTNESRIYLALLQLGESTVQPIAQKAGLQRTYCYDILDELIEKGFVAYAERRGRRRYSATQPKIIKRILMDKIKELDPVLPELEGLYQQAPARPKVRFFEGKEGVQAIYNEILSEAKEEMILGSGEEWARTFSDWYDFIKETVRRGIKVRDTAKRMPESEKWKRLYKKPMQELRFLKEDWNFPSDQFIWGNKIAMVSHGKDMHGIVIESSEIAQSMKTVFEVMWNLAEKD